MPAGPCHCESRPTSLSICTVSCRDARYSYRSEVTAARNAAATPLRHSSLERLAYMRSLRTPSPRGGRYAGLPLALLVSVFTGGCSLLDVEDPVSARVVLEGTAATRVHTIVSTAFQVSNTAGGGTQTNIVRGDTAWVAVPFDKTYDIRTTGQFYVRAFDVDSVAPFITMRVFINDRLDYDVRRNVLETPLEFLFTSYTAR